MTYSEHHRKAIERYQKRFGTSLLREICYHVAKGTNRRKMCEMYGMENYELRYLETIEKETTVYFWETEDKFKQELKLVVASAA